MARYGLGEWVQSRAGFAFPWGTLAVNVLGCLLIGFAVRYLGTVRVSDELRAFVGVGLLGAFTTFSTFGYETVALLEEGAWGRAALYSLGSVALGVLAVYVGMTLFRLVVHMSP